MLFGENTPKRSPAYRYLLAHLARFPQGDDDWLYRLRMVHAKAPEYVDRQEDFRDAAFNLAFSRNSFTRTSHSSRVRVSRCWYDDDNPLLVDKFSLDAREAPHDRLAGVARRQLLLR